MAPNLFYSEPFSNFEINFQIRAVLPLALLFIGGQRFEILWFHYPNKPRKKTEIILNISAVIDV